MFHSKSFISIAVWVNTVGMASLQHEVSGATVAATYLFNDTLASTGGQQALAATNPTNANGFENATVFNQIRRVYRFDGLNSPATQQAGLTFFSTGLMNPVNYSAELVFSLSEGQDQWRRIMDVENRMSDNGLYLNISNALELYPIIGGSTALTSGVYHHVVVTNFAGTTNAYLNGQFQFSVTTNLMDINNPNNPEGLMHLFLDNTEGGGLAEYSDGRIALARFYNGALTDAEVAALALNPFDDIPEPTATVLAFSGLLVLMRRQRRS